MPSRASFTLAGCRRLGISFTWPEAVAIVLEAGEQVKRGDGTLVTPDLDHIRISADGRLTILRGSPIPSHPVRQAARLLKVLIQDASAPADLRELVAHNDQATPACAWIEEFHTALAYFERPHRGRIIADLAGRAIAREATMVPSDASSAREGAGDSPQASGRMSRLFRRWLRL